MRKLFFLILVCILPDLFAQSIGPWTQKAQFPGPGRHRGFGFVIGNKAYIGGGWNSAQIWNDFWEYDPGTNTWTQKGTLPGGAALSSVGFAIGTKGYFVLGLDASFNDIYTLWEYNPVTNSWLAKSTYPGFSGWGYECFVIGNRVYIGEEWSTDIYAWDQSNNTWYWGSAPFTFDRDEVGLSLNGFGYWATATNGAGLWKFNPSGAIWTQLPTMPTPGITEASGFAVGGKLYVGSGQYLATGERLNNFWEFDPVTNQWKQINELPALERDDAIGFTIGNRGYLCTGTNGNNLQDLWEFNPVLATGVDGISSPIRVRIYPNPVIRDATIHIEGIDTNEPLQLIIYDLNGNLVKSASFSENEFKFTRGDLADGTYIYSVSSGSGAFCSGKIILL